MDLDDAKRLKAQIQRGYYPDPIELVDLCTDLIEEMKMRADLLRTYNPLFAERNALLVDVADRDEKIEALEDKITKMGQGIESAYHAYKGVTPNAPGR